MNSISAGITPSIPINRQSTPSPPAEKPAEKPTEVDKDKLREGLVSVVETKQQKELAEQFIESTINANQSNDPDKNSGLGDLQDMAQFARNVKVVQVIDDNDGSQIKEIAENRREKIESFFSGINNPDEVVSTGQQIDSLA